MLIAKEKLMLIGGSNDGGGYLHLREFRCPSTFLYLGHVVRHAWDVGFGVFFKISLKEVVATKAHKIESGHCFEEVEEGYFHGVRKENLDGFQPLSSGRQSGVFVHNLS